MWAQVLVSHHRVTHKKKEKNKVSYSRAEMTMVAMTELMKKKKI